MNRRCGQGYIVIMEFLGKRIEFQGGWLMGIYIGETRVNRELLFRMVGREYGRDI